MEFATDLPSLLNALGATLLAALGVWIALHRPRTPASVGLALFTIGFGAFAIPTYVTGRLVRGEENIAAAIETFRFLAQAIAILGLVALLRVFPRPLTRADRPSIVLALSVFAVGLGAKLASRVSAPRGWQAANWVQDDPLYFTIDIFERLANDVIFGAFPAAAVLLTLRYARLSDATTRTQAAHMAGAFLLYVGFIAGAGASEGRDPIHDPFDLLANAGFALACLIAGTTWLYATTRSDKAARARNLALLSFGMPLVGLIYAATGKGLGGYGIARTAFVLFLAYAILRAQLLGIDVKVRWTISRSTIAAVFIAVFFVASEAAQQFFGETLGSTYIGIAAAGALVFAMAPLQRAAERLAEKAVPPGTPAPPGQLAAERDHYRVLLRRFLADGQMTIDEERALARVATLAGMTPDDTLRARQDVEAELREGA